MSKTFEEIMESLLEVAITPALIRKKEHILQTMKKDIAYYKKEYGKDYLSVMHAIAMSVAKTSKNKA